MDRRLLAGLLFLSASVLAWQANRRFQLREPTDLLETVEMLRQDGHYIGDLLPDDCQAGYQRQPVEQERRPWRHDLVCESGSHAVSRLVLRAHAGRLIDQAGPLRVRQPGGCYGEGLRRFARSEREAWPSASGCWSLRRELGDGVAEVSCCPGDEAVQVTVSSQLGEFRGGLFEGLERSLRDVLEMRGDGRVPENILSALYQQRILRVRGELEDYKLKASTRNAPLIDALLDPGTFEKLRQAYGAPSN